MGETNLELTERNIKDFRRIQEYMLLAREEGSEKVYAKLKKDYITLKAILTVAGINLTELDEIKE